jgi:hypothetical protein
LYCITEVRAITPNGPDFYSLFSFNEDTGSTGFPWAAFNGDGAGCSIDPSGTFSCSGSKSAVVPIEGGKRQVALTAIESPKNWFEDFGSAQLVGGLATVQLDPTFKQTVNANLEYHVFLTPNGDGKGLYVHQKTATSFEVRELGGGKLQREVRLSHHCSAEELREGSLSSITLASSPEAGMEEYARQRNSRRLSFRDQSTPAGPDLFALR